MEGGNNRLGKAQEKPPDVSLPARLASNYRGGSGEEVG